MEEHDERLKNFLIRQTGDIARVEHTDLVERSALALIQAPLHLGSQVLHAAHIRIVKLQLVLHISEVRLLRQSELWLCC